ncbi:CAF17-like 4Fe-4S cluster assembly/insertion protein YgfZ [Sandaracinobacteroides saxicola]|uniref:Folate-binding protein YgfZ n=1 Tax=Sandaracinobacteroides saxicola TaxID=2759707 RepID=A0A7G5IHB0_9SPHN|nr:folate-binding protein YgfZ [Sandaracinobacteroides saxicola]QMW22752.1 folate-binding protein YgfZ [Sandaracinobacteroides saxicola]
MPLAHLSDRALLRLSGADARSFLQGQITNDIALLGPDAPLYAGHLSAQGKTLFAFFLHADGGDVLIDLPAAQADALAKRLTLYKLRRDVRVAPEPALAVFAQWGGGDRRFAAPPGAAEPTAALEDWHVHRLTLGLPDGDEATDLLWLETNAEALGGVSFTKGCYVGQENTARMHHRDKVRRSLVALVTASAHAPGTAIMAHTPAGPREAGTIRGARHGELQMAHVKREFTDATLTVDGDSVRFHGPPAR